MMLAAVISKILLLNCIIVIRKGSVMRFEPDKNDFFIWKQSNQALLEPVGNDPRQITDAHIFAYSL